MKLAAALMLIVLVLFLTIFFESNTRSAIQFGSVASKQLQKPPQSNDVQAENSTSSSTESIENNTNKNIHHDKTNVDPFERQPECAIMKGGSKILSMKNFLKKHGKYISVEEKPRYDHTCFILKPRYNCAHNVENATNQHHGPYAYDYALALVDSNSNSNDRVCDLQQFIKNAGGPTGIGRRILQNYLDKESTNKQEQRSIVEVLLLGTSRLRQLFEALACGFTDQITDFVVVKDARLKLQSLSTFYDENDVAAFVNMDYVKNGSCYLPEKQFKYDEFYWDDGTAIPHNHHLCHDNIASVQFGDHLRVSFIYRPWAWLNTSTPFGMIGFDIHAKQPVDTVLWEPQDISNSTPSWQHYADEDVEQLLYNTFFDARIPASLTRYDVKSVFNDIQIRDTGRYFGADNPWIYDPPDVSHPCMPGQPDDKINFMLWYMLSLSAL